MLWENYGEHQVLWYWLWISKHEIFTMPQTSIYPNSWTCMRVHNSSLCSINKDYKSVPYLGCPIVAPYDWSMEMAIRAVPETSPHFPVLAAVVLQKFYTVTLLILPCFSNALNSNVEQLRTSSHTWASEFHSWQKDVNCRAVLSPINELFSDTSVEDIRRPSSTSAIARKVKD